MEDEKIRKLIALVQSPLRWAKNEAEIQGIKEDNFVYVNTVQALILIEELKEELSKKDPFSSKKFTQKKMFNDGKV